MRPHREQDAVVHKINSRKEHFIDVQLPPLLPKDTEDQITLAIGSDAKAVHTLRTGDFVQLTNCLLKAKEDLGL